jgi:hypothetical protein
MMDRAIRRSILLSISLATATILGAVLRPRASTAASLPAIDLQQMVPATFADWRVEPVPSAGVAVDVQAEIDKVYSQVLDRTYVNAGGQRVMLSIAYGSDQETGTQLHRPEFCYEAQGFQVLTSQDGSLSTGFGKIPVRHMVAARLASAASSLSYPMDCLAWCPTAWWCVCRHSARMPPIARPTVSKLALCRTSSAQ